MSELSAAEAVRLALQWAKENHITPLNTAITVAGVAGVFFLARLSRGARRIVNDVHKVYEQALEDEKRASERLRIELDRVHASRTYLLDELEHERRIKEDLLRTVAKTRAAAAERGE